MAAVDPNLISKCNMVFLEANDVTFLEDHLVEFYHGSKERQFNSEKIEPAVLESFKQPLNNLLVIGPLTWLIFIE